VEDHPAHRNPRLKGLQQVPGDGLSLAVLIRSQVELGGVFQECLELGDLLLLVGRDDVERLEPVVDVHAEACP
jgi:acetylornithine/succinyldiaminopimelate/putrescine aminotransferase